MRLKIIHMIMVLPLLLTIRSMAQTTITYTYDSAGNRTGRAVTVQLLADTTENQAVEVYSFSWGVVDKDAAPSQSGGNEFCAVTPYPGEQKQPLALTGFQQGILCVQKQSPVLSDGTKYTTGVQIKSFLHTGLIPGGDRW